MMIWKQTIGVLVLSFICVDFLRVDALPIVRVKAEQKISDTQGNLDGILKDFDEFGGAITSIGDFDGDGIPDIAAGLPQDDDGAVRAGAVRLIFFNGDGTVKSHVKISATQGGFGGILNAHDGFGYSVAWLGDLGAGAPTPRALAVGQRHYPTDPGPATNACAVWILFLNANGSVNTQIRIKDGEGGFADALNNHMQFGFSLAALGDLDGVGGRGPALAVSGMEDDTVSTKTGIVWIFFLNPTNPSGIVEAYTRFSDPSRQQGLLSAMGDFDGDGVPDLAVGTPTDSDGDQAHCCKGAVFLLSLHANGTLKSSYKISEVQGGIPLGSFRGYRAQFGAGVISLGDIDGNGVPDLAVGAPYEDEVSANPDPDLGYQHPHGVVWILYLQRDQGTQVVKATKKIYPCSDGFTGTLNDNDAFGSALANADLDGDSVRDLMVGAYGDQDGVVPPGASATDRGAVWTVFLNADGTAKAGTGTSQCAPAGSPNSKHQKVSDTQGGLGLTGTLKNSDQLGTAITSIGDLDGDGVPDAAVGLPRTGDGAPNSGAIRILFLNADGTVKTHRKISNTQGGFSGTLNEDDQFGASVAWLGDLGSGAPTPRALAVGALHYSPYGFGQVMTPNESAIWILFLNADGSVQSQQKIKDGVGGFAASFSNQQRFAMSLAWLGNLGAGATTSRALAVGSIDTTRPGNVGVVWILFLKADGTVQDYTRFDSSTVNLSGAWPLGIPVVSALGDFDGDGIQDLAVGSPGDPDPVYFGTAQGAVWLLSLNVDGTVKAINKISKGHGLPTNAFDTDAELGTAVAPVGDLDHDGVVDIAVGVPQQDTSRGQTWIIHLKHNEGDGVVVKAIEKIFPGSNGFVGPLITGDRFGSSLALMPDMDGDLVPELAVGADEDNDGGQDRGAVWILRLNPSICGNGLVGPDEQCDDGNILDGDCCSLSCQLESTGSACPGGVCDGAGGCSTYTPTSTATETGTSTPTETPTDTATATPSATPTSSPTDTSTSTLTPTNTPTSTATSTSTSTLTATRTATATSTPTSTSTMTPTPTSTSTPLPACGDHIVQAGESCDDGNHVDCDGCDSNCTLSGPGNGVLCPPEQCDDGNVVNGDCCSAAGQFEASGGACAADNNGCTNDVCNATGVCTHPNNAALCDDGLFCNGTDTCGGGACSVHSGSPCSTQCNATCAEATDSCFDAAGTHCDDGDACTLHEVCDGAGQCVGEAVAVDFAVLRWPPVPPTEVELRLGRDAEAQGNVCADVIRLGRSACVGGDAIASKGSGTALTVGLSSTISGNVLYTTVSGTVVTGGGTVSHADRCFQQPCSGGAPNPPVCPLIIDPPASLPYLERCSSSACRAASRQAEWALLPQNLNAGTVALKRSETKSLPSTGTLGAGVVVIDVQELRIGRNATLQLVGGPTTQRVIVRVAGDVRLAKQASLQLTGGLTPEQVVITANGAGRLGADAHFSGTLVVAKTMTAGRDSITEGALLAAKDITLRASAIVRQHSFNGW